MPFVVLILLLCTGWVQAAGTSSERPASSESLVTESQAESWLKIWQHRLGLLDWTVEVRIVRSWELNPDTLGHLYWNAGTKKATIKLLNPVDYDLPPGEVPRDMELTVVHELLHLQLSALPRDNYARSRDRSYKSAEEKIVDRISRALMGLDKKR